jgi:transcriptional regulator with XRE-family HTH domain
MEQLGKRVKKIRNSKGMRLEDLAERIGTGRSNLGHIERGRNAPSVELLVKLADFFQVSTDYLLGRTDEMEMKVSEHR